MALRGVGWRTLVAAVAVALLATGCSWFGNTKGSAPQDATVWFAFGLERDQKGLEGFAADVANPGSASFRQFVMVDDVADKYGADSQSADQALSTLEEAGFTGKVDATRGLIVGTFKVSDAETFFNVSLNSQTSSSGTVEIVPSQDLKVPNSLGDSVSQVFGGRATVPEGAASGPASTSASAESFPLPACPPEMGAEGIREKVAALYGLIPLDKAGLTGAGVRVGVIDIDAFSKQATSLFAKCSGLADPTINPIKVNATEDQLKDSTTESSIDVAALSLVAPGLAEIDMFQFDGYTSLVFPFSMVIDRQADPNTALDLLSSSVAFCASSLEQDELEMSEWLMMTAGSVGLSVLASSGDTGSSGCYPPNKDADTQYPSESPNVLSVGGTQLPSLTSPVEDSEVWNESPAQELAGGGGPAGNFDRPSYQDKTGVDESKRQSPDVAFLADPSEVGAIAVCNPDQPCTFENIAGTSATAPALGGGLALIVEQRRKVGLDPRLGLLNPSIYQLAEGPQASSIFADVTKGTNDLFGIGCCDAGPGFDMASGWGSMYLDKLAKGLEELESKSASAEPTPEPTPASPS